MVKVMKLTDPEADGYIAECFGRTPILIQLPTVFAIFAPATQSGATLLDQCKAGSITQFDAALAFARKRGVELVLTHDAAVGRGSQPILGISDNRVTTLRDGPGGTEKSRLLQGWLDRALAYSGQILSHGIELHRVRWDL